MIEYDKRIKEPTKILTPFSSGMEDYYGKECYFADDLCDFWNLEECIADILVDKPLTNDNYQFTTEHDHFKYCLPSEFVETIKEQLRPFKTAKELPFTVGDKVYFKGKGLKPYVYTIVSALNFNSNGTLTCINFGCSEIIDTEDLFNDYEWKFGLDSEWRPFGVEE